MTCWAAASALRLVVSIRTSGMFGCLVRVRDARELLDDPGACLGVQALAVAALADLDRGRKVHEDEAARDGSIMARTSWRTPRKARSARKWRCRRSW